MAQVCGDGVVEPPEKCDLGDRNGIDPRCGANCEVGSCGDGQVEPPEQCDDGPDNSDTRPDACRHDCVAPFCGDGVVDTGEECDDGGTVSLDGCSAVCTVETTAPDSRTFVLEGTVDDFWDLLNNLGEVVHKGDFVYAEMTLPADHDVPSSGVLDWTLTDPGLGLRVQIASRVYESDPRAPSLELGIASSDQGNGFGVGSTKNLPTPEAQIDSIGLSFQGGAGPLVYPRTPEDLLAYSSRTLVIGTYASEAHMTITVKTIRLK